MKYPIKTTEGRKSIDNNRNKEQEQQIENITTMVDIDPVQ